MIDSGEKSIDVLWLSFLKGDENSFALIYQQSVNGLMLYGLKFTTDREIVHDCLQEVFIDLFTKKKKLGRNIKRIKPYLFVAVRNGIIKKMMRENKYRSVSLEEINNNLDFNVEYSAEQYFIKNEKNKRTQERIRDAVNNLPPRQKEIVYLKFEEELDYNDISEVMNISIESARKSVYRSILSLRKLLGNE